MSIHPVDGGLILGACSLWHKIYIMFSFIFLAKFSLAIFIFISKMAKNMCSLFFFLFKEI
jgi:hypothetical protein